jgi:hypothetical protein
MSLKSECEHSRECDDCSGMSGEIHRASIRIQGWAGAIAELAVQAAREEDDPARREMLLSGIGGLAFAIDRLTDIEIRSETIMPRDEKPAKLKRAS